MESVDEVLALELDGLEPLRSPVMLIALTGLFDIAGAATTALDEFAPVDAAVTIAEIDPDPFYDFTQARPQVEFDEDDGSRVISWPDNQFDVVRGQGDRDLVVLVGTEPHLGWRTYAGCIRKVAEVLGCEAVVTVGATAEPIPHTRQPTVRMSTTSAALASALGIGQPTYQGPTGVAGVIQSELAEAGIACVSLRVGIPHYLMNAEHPLAVVALQTHLGHVLGVPAPEPAADRDVEITRWRELHDEVVDNDDQLASYVTELEADYDRRAEATIPTAEALAADFERFLRNQHPDD